VLLPGLGADHRLFARQQEAFPELRIPQWLQPQPSESLSSYATRLATQVAVTRPLILGGCSFGGMVAYEMARTLRPEALVLIGSAAGDNEIPVFLRWLSIVSSAIPGAGFGVARLAAPAMARLFGIRDIEHRVLFTDMLRSTPAEFLRWACTSVGRWNPQPPTGVPIFSIHGAEDRVLPLRGRSADVIVQGAGHLIAITHAERVNEFLLEVKRRTLETPPGTVVNDQTLNNGS
jgi:pimeloyl-ACP methyl ester carboxylesterase